MQQKTSYPADANYEVTFEWYARVESNHRTRLRRPLLYPLSYGRVYRTNVIIAQGCRRCNPLFEKIREGVDAQGRPVRDVPCPGLEPGFLFSVQCLEELFRPCFFRMVEHFVRSPGFHHLKTVLLAGSVSEPTSWSPFPCREGQKICVPLKGGKDPLAGRGFAHLSTF